MFDNSIFNNTEPITQQYSFEYLGILWPLNNQTELTIGLYSKLNNLMNDKGSMWDID